MVFLCSPVIRGLNCNRSHGNLYEQWAVLKTEQQASCMHIDFLLKMSVSPFVVEVTNKYEHFQMFTVLRIIIIIIIIPGLKGRYYSC